LTNKLQSAFLEKDGYQESKFKVSENEKEKMKNLFAEMQMLVTQINVEKRQV